MLVINPDECIDCGVCEPECPIEAIKSDEELMPHEEEFADINVKFSALWPNITKSKGPLPEADEYAEKDGKLALLSKEPGAGDE